jgi:hypothetical protein
MNSYTDPSNGNKAISKRNLRKINAEDFQSPEERVYGEVNTVKPETGMTKSPKSHRNIVSVLPFIRESEMGDKPPRKIQPSTEEIEARIKAIKDAQQERKKERSYSLSI